MMQIQYIKNLNPLRFELGTTFEPIWSRVRTANFERIYVNLKNSLCIDMFAFFPLTVTVLISLVIKHALA